MQRSLKAGRRVVLAQLGLFADGVAVRQVGEETRRLAPRFLDEVIVADTDELCAAIKDVFEDTRSIVEPRPRSGSQGLSATPSASGSRGGRSSRS
jgi:threonine dehydratase